jgi:hypothetical protein
LKCRTLSCKRLGIPVGETAELVPPHDTLDDHHAAVSICGRESREAQ